MADVYQLVSSDPSPVTLAEAKAHLRVGHTADDTLIQGLIDACTEWGESYTRRSFRAQTWKLLLDAFAACIEIRRQPVDAITSITHIVADAPTTVDAATYYLKQTAQAAQVLLADGQEWPTDTDERDQAIVVKFTTTAWSRHAELIREAILRHVGELYTNRGDCTCTPASAATASSAATLYDMFRVERV